MAAQTQCAHHQCYGTCPINKTLSRGSFRVKLIGYPTFLQRGVQVCALSPFFSSSLVCTSAQKAAHVLTCWQHALVSEHTNP